MTDFSDMFRALSNPREMAKIELSNATKEYMERVLMLLQIIQISVDLYGEEEAEKMTKPYSDAVVTIADNMNKAVEKFNREHGEI